MTAVKHREEGNVHFKNQQFEEAIKCFNRSLCDSMNDNDRASAMKNLTAAHLNLSSHPQALYHAEEALKYAISALDFGLAAGKDANWINSIKSFIDRALNNFYRTVINVYHDYDVEKRIKLFYRVITHFLSEDHRMGLKSRFQLKVADVMIKRAIQLQEEGNDKVALNLLHRCNQEIAFAADMASRSRAFPLFPQGALDEEIEEMHNSCKYENCYAKTSQMLDIGKTSLQNLLGDENFSVDLVWNCIDYFHQGIIYSSEENIIKLEIRAAGHLGEVYYKVLKNEEYATRYFDRFWELTNTLGGPGPFIRVTWWEELAKVRQELAQEIADREEAKKQEVFKEIKKLCKEDFDALQKKFDEGTVPLLKFVWEKYPPVTKDVFTLPDTIPADNLKTTVLQCIRYFHPDKHQAKWDSGEQESKKNYVIYSEITKHLNRKYSVLKSA